MSQTANDASENKEKDLAEVTSKTRANTKTEDKPKESRKRSLEDRLKTAFGDLAGKVTNNVRPLEVIRNKTFKGGLYIRNGEIVNAWNEPFAEEELEKILDAAGVE